VLQSVLCSEKKAEIKSKKGTSAKAIEILYIRAHHASTKTMQSDKTQCIAHTYRLPVHCKNAFCNLFSSFFCRAARCAVVVMQNFKMNQEALLETKKKTFRIKTEARETETKKSIKIGKRVEECRESHREKRDAE
jgi:hypothetical protein